MQGCIPGPDLFKICVDDLEDENVPCHVKFTLDTKLEGWSIYSKHGCHPEGPTQAAGIGLRRTLWHSTRTNVKSYTLEEIRHCSSPRHAMPGWAAVLLKRTRCLMGSKLSKSQQYALAAKMANSTLSCVHRTTACNYFPSINTCQTTSWIWRSDLGASVQERLITRSKLNGRQTRWPGRLEHVPCKGGLRAPGLFSLEKRRPWRHLAADIQFRHLPGAYQEPDSLPKYKEGWQYSTDRNRNKRGSQWIEEKAFPAWRLSSSGTSCTERLCYLHLWRFSRCDKDNLYQEPPKILLVISLNT